ncbi:SSI family serine proteinase inhibitor [Candidatus Methylocalor cossyra]|uniref:SSI domain-containing protein n=1 Tax=Candidatus Methylocalor cossyra TaxID=3108543 RepID=A0ABM9NL26_9GAMM
MKTSPFLSRVCGPAVMAAVLTTGTAPVSAVPEQDPKGAAGSAAIGPGRGGQGTLPARELVLTFAEGEYAEPVKSAVTLSCTNVSSAAQAGSHPSPKEACADLDKANATLAGLPKDPNAVCTMEFRPVTVTISGAWNGRLVAERATYGNLCQLVSNTGTVFRDWPSF